MKSLSATLVLALVLMMGCDGQTALQDDDLAAGTAAIAAKKGPGGGGNPDRGGGRGGGGTPGGGGGSGDIYADLVYLYRNPEGLPLLRLLNGEYCLQPVSSVAIPGVDATINPADGSLDYLIPLWGDLSSSILSVVGVLAEEEDEVEVCDVYTDYLGYVQEVPLSRLNMGRSPDRVLDRALEEVLLKFGTANELLLDHAGRIVPDGIPIDAPGENLAIHRELMTVPDAFQGTLPTPKGWAEGTYSFLDHAASALGASVDKFGIVDLDLVVYNNRILGIPNETQAMPTLTGDGETAGEAGEKYVDFSGYSYDRAETFPGCIEWWEFDETTATQHRGTILDAVFGGEPFSAASVHGFAQRADDVRAVVLFEHDFTVTRIDRIGESEVCSLIN